MAESVVPDATVPRRFILVRDEDVSEMSGVGFVAEGVCFWDGSCAMRWRTNIRSTTIYDSVDDLLALHGHEGRTTIKWIDKEPWAGQPL